MQSRFYKIHFFCIFSSKNLHISKKSCTFAQNLKKQHCLTIKNTKL